MARNSQDVLPEVCSGDPSWFPLLYPSMVVTFLNLEDYADEGGGREGDKPEGRGFLLCSNDFRLFQAEIIRAEHREKPAIASCINQISSKPLFALVYRLCFHPY